MLHVQTKLKLPITARTDICSKQKTKQTVCLKIFMFPRILAVLAISSNMHYGALTTFTQSFRPRFTTHPKLRNAFKREREELQFFRWPTRVKKFEMVVNLTGILFHEGLVT